MTSYLTFYLKGHIGIHSDHVDLTIPNTIFGLIPLGSNNRSIDVNQIVSPVSNFKVTPLTLILGFLSRNRRITVYPRGGSVRARPLG